MKPIKFKQQTKTLHRPTNMTPEDCGPLPVFTDGKQCLSCWKATWGERLSILFYGKVWLGVRSGNTQPPVWLRGFKAAFFKG